MNNETHIPDDDLVLFALQFLPEDRVQAAHEHLKNCITCRDELARLQGDLVAYAMTAEVVAPPPAARERLLRQVAKEPKIVAKTAPAADSRPVAAPGRNGEPIFPTRQNRILPTESRDEEETRQRPRRAPWVLAWTGWAVAAGCSFVAGLQLHQRQQMQISMATQQASLDQSTQSAAHAQDALATLTAADAQQVSLHLAPATLPKKPGNPAAAITPEALAAYIAQKGTLVFVATHLQPLPGDKTYELWLLPANGMTPIPAGTFKPDAQGSASVVLPHLPKGIPAKGFGVTIENEGGSSTPTLPLVMAGA